MAQAGTRVNVRHRLVRAFAGSVSSDPPTVQTGRA